MAVAVEHLSKAYLASISDVLLADDKPNWNDLLILSGNEDRIRDGQQRSRVRTANGEVAAKRVVQLGGVEAKDADGLQGLRDVRNGVTHLGTNDGSSASHELLKVGIVYLNAVLESLGRRDGATFWGDHLALTEQLVEQALVEAQLRYEHKLRKARERFDQQFGKMTPEGRLEAIAALSAHPVLSRWRCVVPWECPACESSAVISGREYSEDFGSWFNPRYFGCRVCGLTLEGEELKSAGISGNIFDHGDEMPEDWEPDFDHRDGVPEDWDPED